MNEPNETDGRPLCRLCEEFNGAYRCASPLECDCPKCSGLCRCDTFEDVLEPKSEPQQGTKPNGRE